MASQYFQFIIGNVREFRHEISHEGFHVEFTNQLRDVGFRKHIFVTVLKNCFS